MWFRTLFDSLKSGRSRTPVQHARRGPPRRRPAACQLAVEALEDRCVPCSLTADPLPEPDPCYSYYIDYFSLPDGDGGMISPCGEP